MQKPLGPYTPVVRAGDWLIVSGQVGARDGVLADGVPAQTAQAIENLSAQLATMGATLADIKKTLCFLIDMDEFATFNEAYIAGFGDSRPGPVHGRRGRPPHGRAGGDRGLGLQARVMACDARAEGAGRAGPLRVGRSAQPDRHRRTTTTCGGRRSGTRGRCSSSSSSRARRPGLSWRTILNKREGYRAAFAGFDPVGVAAFDERDVERLLADPGIVRNRAKIDGALGNARAWLELDDPVAFLWIFVDGRPVQGRYRVLGRDAGPPPRSPIG